MSARSLPASVSRRPSVSRDRFDRGFRRRIVIALAISVVVNLVVFGYAGKLGHHFLRSLEVMREKDGQVNIRRVYLPPSTLKAMQHPAVPLRPLTSSPSPTPVAPAADARL